MSPKNRKRLPKKSLSPRKSGNLVAGNYCVCFIDLLGQSEAMRGQGLLPTNEEERIGLVSLVRNTVGAILDLQENAETMLRDRPTKSKLRNLLSREDKIRWDNMSRERVQTQRWSDGLMSFTSLGNREVKCRMNGIHRLFCLAGSLCFLGLAREHPLRGAIDIAWGVELRKGELYGPALACAYDLESKVAQYPRIIVGQRVIDFVQLNASNLKEDPYSKNDRELAQICLEMVSLDSNENQWSLDYLGSGFKKYVSGIAHETLFPAAYNFVKAQLAQHRLRGNEKLISRYEILYRYFEASVTTNTEPLVSLG